MHFGDTLHTTPPPTGENAGRRVLYFKFPPPRVFRTIPAGGHDNDVLFQPDSSGRVATWDDDDSQSNFQSRRLKGD